MFRINFSYSYFSSVLSQLLFYTWLWVTSFITYIIELVSGSNSIVIGKTLRPTQIARVLAKTRKKNRPKHELHYDMYTYDFRSLDVLRDYRF